MQPLSLIFPSLWQVKNDPVLLGKYRFDFRSVSSDLFAFVREKAVMHDVKSMMQLIVWSKRNIQQRNVLEWVDFFERLDLKDSVLLEFYLKGYIANHFCDILRKRKFRDKELSAMANHPVLRDWILHSFVDYGTLAAGKYYGRLVAEFNPETIEQETFKKSLILTQHYLQGNNEMVKKWSEALSRYPTSQNYFPIINGRVWSARFLNQKVKTGALRRDLVSDWYRSVREQPVPHIMPYSMEPLPILVRFAEDTQQIQEILDYVGRATQLTLQNNPLVASVDHAVYLACESAFHARVRDYENAQVFRQKLQENNCLPSYSGYIFGISNTF